ncbi:MAG: aminoacyl--tRNA ligase-related protein [Hyphomicrobiaceae bacterium]
MNQQVRDLREVTLALPREVDDEVAGDIQKESVFVSPGIDRIVVNADMKTACVKIRPNAHSEELLDKAKRFLEVMSKQTSGFDIKVFNEHQRKDTGPYETKVNRKLVERGWLHDYGKGQVAYSGPVLNLARLVNEKAGELYADAFNAFDSHFPALVDADTLHKCGYFDSHPNAVTFIGNMMEDFDAIEEFRAANSCSEGALLPRQEHVHNDGMCLNPAACFPCYPTLTGKTFQEGQCYTWLGRVFRYESRNIDGLDRLYEFNVRELVFVGSEDYCRDCRSKALPVVEDLATFFDLDLKVQTATDPFFATVSAAKKFWQAAQEVKNEIKIPVLDGDGNSKLLACGSINLHGKFFGDRFDITTGDGASVHTGCVGLGIERWVLAAFTQHGFDEARWPEPVREIIFE